MHTHVRDLYVDPMRPTRSVLKRGVSWANLFAAVSGLGLAVLVVVLLIRDLSNDG